MPVMPVQHLCAEQGPRKKNYAGSENHSPHEVKGKVSHFGTEYRKTPLPADKTRPSQRGPTEYQKEETRQNRVHSCFCLVHALTLRPSAN
jgi:hypothetical protein